MTPVETLLIAAAFVLVAVMWIVLYPRPRLQLTERGFLDRDLRLGWIGWDEIEGGYTPDVECLRLRLRPRRRLLRRLQRREALDRSADGSWELRLDLAETDVSPVELLQEVLARCGSPSDEPAAHGAGNASRPPECREPSPL